MFLICLSFLFHADLISMICFSVVLSFLCVLYSFDDIYVLHLVLFSVHRFFFSFIPIFCSSFQACLHNSSTFSNKDMEKDSVMISVAEDQILIKKPLKLPIIPDHPGERKL